MRYVSRALRGQVFLRKNLWLFASLAVLCAQTRSPPLPFGNVAKHALSKPAVHQALSIAGRAGNGWRFHLPDRIWSFLRLMVLRHLICAAWSLRIGYVLKTAYFSPSMSRGHSKTSGALLLLMTTGLFLASMYRMYADAHGYCEAFFHCLINKCKTIYLVNRELTLLSK
jgi:hypothetical protein